MNNIKISKMMLDDFNQIKDILISDFDDFWNVNTLEQELNNENSYYLVAKIENEIVGFAGMKSVLDEADIMNIVTKKDKRNSGIGTALLENLLNTAKKKKIKKITLEVNESNSSAIHLYKNFGFKEICIREKYYNKTDNALIMQLSLI
ncbi:MAG: ribosomal protein S18-alanine N-acetyltransferase [Clostridia bacterium]|nr:ribosomal protein S18-alanine N-acetyltransferase [Clostridia bacterium]